MPKFTFDSNAQKVIRDQGMCGAFVGHNIVCILDPADHVHLTADLSSEFIQAAEAVCSWDYSDDDEEPQRDVERLRDALRKMGANAGFSR